MMTIGRLFTFCLVGTAAVFGQAFTDKGFHPKMTSLGRAVVAMHGDAALMFYNPASIAFGPEAQAYAGFTELYPSVLDDQLNVVNAAGTFRFKDIGTAGIGVSQFSPNFWTERTIVLSFATEELFNNLSVGASAKILSWSAESPQGDYAVPEPAFSFTGVSFDVGAYYRLNDFIELNDLQFGLSVQDITQPSIASNGSSGAALPVRISLGSALISRKHLYSVYGAASLVQNDVKVHFGYEASVLKVTTLGVNSEFFVRLGAGRITKSASQGEYNGGFGLAAGPVSVDYSYSYQAFIRNVGGISSIAVSYAF